MSDTNNLQSEVNTLLTPIGDTLPVPVVLPLEQIQVNQSDMLGEIRPAVDVPQFSPIVPPIQRQTEEFSSTTEERANKQFNFLLLIGILGIVAIIVLVSFFRKRIFGTLTYSDCIAIPESKTVSLRPRYCVTPEGAVFFQNKSDAPTKITNEDGEQETSIPMLPNERNILNTFE